MATFAAIRKGADRLRSIWPDESVPRAISFRRLLVLLNEYLNYYERNEKYMPRKNKRILTKKDIFRNNIIHSRRPLHV